MLHALDNLRQAAKLLPAQLPEGGGAAEGQPADRGRAGQDGAERREPPRVNPGPCAEPPSADYMMVGCNRSDHLPCDRGFMAYVRTGQCAGVHYRCVADPACLAPACAWVKKGCGGQGNAYRQGDYVREIQVSNQNCKGQAFDMGKYDNACFGGCSGACKNRGGGYTRGLCQATGTGAMVGYCQYGGQCFCYK